MMAIYNNISKLCTMPVDFVGKLLYFQMHGNICNVQNVNIIFLLFRRCCRVDSRSGQMFLCVKCKKNNQIIKLCCLSPSCISWTIITEQLGFHWWFISVAAKTTNRGWNTVKNFLRDYLVFKLCFLIFILLFVRNLQCIDPNSHLTGFAELL